MRADILNCEALRHFEGAEAFYKQKLQRAKFYQSSYANQLQAIVRIGSIKSRMSYVYSYRYFLEYLAFEKCSIKHRKYASEERLAGSEFFDFLEIKNYLLTKPF